VSDVVLPKFICGGGFAGLFGGIRLTIGGGVFLGVPTDALIDFGRGGSLRKPPGIFGGAPVKGKCRMRGGR